MTTAAETRVVLYTREACHLCEDARAVVEKVCESSGTAWREVDIDSAPALREKYGEYVPVLEVDGVQQGFWRVDGARLARLLA
ncbi:glutaredoxin family protein [Promicromonospora sp. MEB111]|uniref:glutaredoxin family protein n=1 Tax=unclassified Promicromonospora TaxID=2647929 RepID=UPI00254DD1EB|nr:glutaredoxin family protein [Promicromonospora sp. MEB111]